MGFMRKALPIATFGLAGAAMSKKKDKLPRGPVFQNRSASMLGEAARKNTPTLY